MKRIYQYTGLAILMSILLSSCYINQSVMLKTDRDYTFSAFPDTSKEEYIISPNDVFTFRLLYNDGFKMIDLTTDGQGQRNNLRNQGKINIFKLHDIIHK